MEVAFFKGFLRHFVKVLVLPLNKEQYGQIIAKALISLLLLSASLEDNNPKLLEA
jgi:hypothetical protein